MIDKHTAPWHVVYNFEEKKCSVSDSGENKLSSREIVESHNALAAERDELRAKNEELVKEYAKVKCEAIQANECLRQNAAMIKDLKAAHDAHELTKAKLKRAVEAVDVSWLDTTCKCTACQHRRVVIAENAELLKEIT